MSTSRDSPVIGRSPARNLLALARRHGIRVVTSDTALVALAQGGDVELLAA